MNSGIPRTTKESTQARAIIIGKQKKYMAEERRILGGINLRSRLMWMDESMSMGV